MTKWAYTDSSTLTVTGHTTRRGYFAVQPCFVADSADRVTGHSQNMVDRSLHLILSLIWVPNTRGCNK